MRWLFSLVPRGSVALSLRRAPSWFTGGGGWAREVFICLLFVFIWPFGPLFVVFFFRSHFGSRPWGGRVCSLVEGGPGPAGPACWQHGPGALSFASPWPLKKRGVLGQVGHGKLPFTALLAGLTRFVFLAFLATLPQRWREPCRAEQLLLLTMRLPQLPHLGSGFHQATAELKHVSQMLQS